MGTRPMLMSLEARMNVRDLITSLEEFAEAHGDEAKVLIVHQPNWPLQEVVRGVWSPLLSGDHVMLASLDNCSVCGSQVTAPGYEMVQAYWNDETEEYSVCSECQQKEHGGKGADEPVVWIVAGGHPNNMSPYGPRRAFEEV